MAPTSSNFTHDMKQKYLELMNEAANTYIELTFREG